jgi:predicted DNA-binding transcriptional regulator AlpA
MNAEPLRIPAPVDPIEQLIGVEEVARRLDVSEDTVWVMSKDGRFIPPLHVGRLAKWRVRDLNRWVEERAIAIKTIDAAAKRSIRRSRRA